MQKLINCIQLDGTWNLTPAGEVFQSQMNLTLMPIIESFKAQGFYIIEMERIITNLLININD